MRTRLVVLVLLASCGAKSSLGYLAPPAGDDPRVGLGQLGGGRLAAALAREYEHQRDHRPPPISLVPTDGSELVLRKLSATVTLEGPLAHTELRLMFHNPEPRTREGRFAITLPAGAAVGRFAMKVHGQWREARVVSRERGREVYETFLHRKVDPALLEQDVGNQFSARVFPIFPGEHKELILAYDHQVSAERPYALHLQGLPKLAEAAIEILRDGSSRTIERFDAVPEDLVVEIDGGVVGLVGEGAFVARLDGVAPTEPAPLGRVLYLVDTSASRAAVMARQVAVLRRLVAAHAPQSEIVIAAFDHRVTEVYRGPAREAGRALPALLVHGALGASNLGAALEYATRSAMTRVVVIGDGAPTLGEREPAKLAAIVAGAVERLDAVQVGPSIDRDTLQWIVRAGRRPGAILDGTEEAIARQLATAIAPSVPIRVEGATASWPATTAGLAPGDPIWVFGLFTAGASAPLSIRVGDQLVMVTPRKGHPTRVRRAVARAELTELTERLQGAEVEARTALATQLEEIALAHQLVSVRTSLIVLETDADEHAMLGPRDPTAPAVDVAATGQGIVLARDHLQNLPVGSSAGSQGDSLGVSFACSTSIENQYYVDGINTAGYTSGEAILLISSGRDRAGIPAPSGGRRFAVYADTMSPLALDLVARSLGSTAFAFRDSYRDPPDTTPRYAAPYAGRFEQIMGALAMRDRDRALDLAAAWQLASPADVAAILALGEALEARGAGELAARAYGSLLDLYPNRAELLRVAGERLDRVGGAGGVSIDAYERALHERPDHATTYRLLAYAYLRAGRGDDALDTLLAGLRHASRPSVQHVLAQDAGLVGAYLVARAPARRTELLRRLPLGLATRPSLRFVLSWETDANDVDLHVRDGRGGHAFYKGSRLASGGRLLDDLTDGYGPEMFVVEEPGAFPYTISAHYYNQGPMGVGLGTVQVIRHDGAGEITIEGRPFAIQNANAMVELGAINER